MPLGKKLALLFDIDWLRQTVPNDLSSEPSAGNCTNIGENDMTTLVKIEWQNGNFPVEATVMNVEVAPRPHSNATHPVKLDENNRSAELYIHSNQYIIVKEIDPTHW